MNECRCRWCREEPPPPAGRIITRPRRRVLRARTCQALPGRCIVWREETGREQHSAGQT